MWDSLFQQLVKSVTHAQTFRVQVPEENRWVVFFESRTIQRTLRHVPFFSFPLVSRNTPPQTTSDEGAEGRKGLVTGEKV